MRIVSLAPAITETLVLLGAGDELAGVSVYCRDYAPGKPIVGTYISVIWRRLEQARPDIVLLQDYVQRGLYEELRRRGYRAYIFPLPSSLHGIAENAAAIGAVTGRRLEGLMLAEKLEEEIARLKETKPERTMRVYAEYIWPDYTTRMSPGALSFADHALRLAGAENIYAGEPQAFVEPRSEDVIATEPEAVIVSAEKLMKLTKEKYLEKTPWIRRLRAIKEDKLIILSGEPGQDLAHPGPSIIETTRKLRTLLHEIQSMKNKA